MFLAHCTIQYAKFLAIRQKRNKKPLFSHTYEKRGSCFSSSFRYDTTGAAYLKHQSLSRLLYVVYSLGQTRDLSGCSILMINALGSSLINGGNSVLQSSNSSFLIALSYSYVNLLHSGLYAGLDGLITSSLGFVNQNSLLSRFNVCQICTPPNCMISILPICLH